MKELGKYILGLGLVCNELHQIPSSFKCLRSWYRSNLTPTISFSDFLSFQEVEKKLDWDS
jgi:hypothetical protein